MSKKFILNSTVSYKDVDRSETLLLSSVFKYFQETAVQHANQFNIGTRTAASRSESWVINRMSVALHRYPRHEELLRIETWSSGVHGVRGYRDYRLFAGNELTVSASSLWLYVNLKTKSLTRVPIEVATDFPTIDDETFDPSLDKFSITPPDPAASTCAVSLRYSDVDSNGHINNTSYFDFLQTALIKDGQSPKPSRLKIKFLKEIRPEIGSIIVKLEPRSEETVFSILAEDWPSAEGQLSYR